MRLTATLLITVALVWIGFNVWLFFSTASGPQDIARQLPLLPLNLLLNAWPAFILLIVALGIAWLYRDKSRNGDAS